MAKVDYNLQKESILLEFKPQFMLDYCQLVYVATEKDNVLTSYIEQLAKDQWEIELAFGFKIVYMPNLSNLLTSKDVLYYYAPYCGNEDLKHVEVGNDFLLQYLNNPSDKEKIKHGLMRLYDFKSSKEGAAFINKYYPLTSKDSYSVKEQIQAILNQIAGELVEKHRQNKESYNEVIAYSTECIERDEKPQFDADEHFNYKGIYGDVSDLLEEVREKIERLRQYGISAQVLEELLHPAGKLSKLVISKDYRILLPDYNNLEIKMEPLTKAVYLLFLSHPEGILFKHLPDYRKELTQIYVKLKPYGLNDRAIHSIEDVTNPLLNSINEKCARIRGAFVGLFDNQMAKHYYISGKRGEAKSISLSRDLVVWE